MISTHLGFDDTDSVRGGCTTYIAALLIEKIVKRHAHFYDYPNLIRLNPNIPWKTRGNGALCLRFSIDRTQIDPLMDEVADTIQTESDLDSPNTDPGIVLYVGKKIPTAITDFAKQTIQSIANMKTALELIKQYKCPARGFKKRRGLIGALAAIGEPLIRDHTYELIAYRHHANRGTPRQVSYTSVVAMDQQTQGSTFNNVDYRKKRVLITPRGPDPVLLGIRGERPDVLKKAFDMLDIGEKVERWVIFRTNQGTDAHLRRVEEISQVRAHTPVIVRGTVTQPPKTVPRRNVIFSIQDPSGSIDCAAYEPSGKLRNIARRLCKGDAVEVFGGVRPPTPAIPKTINLEKLRVITLVPKQVAVNPRCRVCGKGMKSMGRGQGYRCKRCGIRDKDAEKKVTHQDRGIDTQLYLPPPRAQRHLTKPFPRYGREKHGINFSCPTIFWGVQHD